MKKSLIINAFILSLLMLPQVAYAQTASGSVNNVITFIKSLIGFVAAAGTVVCALIIAYGGFRYMTSVGSPDSMESAKKTMWNAGIGLIIVLGAYLITGIISQFATTAGFTAGQ